MAYVLNGKEVSYSRFYDTAREFTPEQVAEAAADAVDNWDWDAEGVTDGQKERMADIDAEYARTQWADDDGIIRIGRGHWNYANMWDFLDEVTRYG